MNSINKTHISVLAICLFYLSVNMAFGQLSGWSYVVPVTVTENSGAALTDHQVVVTFDSQSLISAGKMKTDGSDIRFAKDALGDTLISFWVENGINTPNTRVWVKVPGVAASSTATVYLFYGNPGATDVSDAAATFISLIGNLQYSSALNENSGLTTSDRSGNNISGTLTGGPTWGTGRCDSSAVDFDGVDDYIACNTSAALQFGTGDFSVSCWVKGTNLSLNGDNAFVDKYVSDSDYGWMLKERNGGVALLTVDAGSWDQSFGTILVNDGLWHHVVATRSSGGNKIIYIDNVVDLNYTVTVRNVSSARDLEIGRMQAFSNYVEGTIDEVYIYNKVLSPAEVADLYGEYTYASPALANTTLVRKCAAPEPTAVVGAESLLSSLSLSDVQICSGDSAQLLLTVDTSGGLIPPFTYAWTPATDLSCTTCQSPYASPTTTTSYQVVVTDSIGVMDSISVLVSVSSALPVADAGLDTSMCEGDSVQLTGSGGVTYAWSPGTGLTDSTIASPVALPTTSTTYVLTATNGCGSDADTVAVTVNPLPVIASSDTGVCPGDSVQLSASGGVAYLWSPGASLDDSTIATPMAFPAVTTVYNITATSAAGCSNMTSVTVTVDSVAQVFASADRDTICPNDSTQLNVLFGTDCNDYDIAPITFAPLAGAGTGVALGDDQVSAGYPIGFTFNFYCADYTTFYISSNGFITFTNDPNSGCCTGQFLPSISAPNNLIAFAWEDLNPGSGGTITYFTTGTAPNRVLAMNFTAVPHYGGGNNVTSQVLLYEGSNIIEIHTTSMPNDGGGHTMGIENVDGTIAHVVAGRNSSGSWNAVNEGIRFSPLQTADTTLTYTWTPATGLSNPNIINPMASPSVTTTYVVEAAIGSCSSTDTITIYVDTSNSISIIASTLDICQGDSVTLSAVGTPGMPDTSTWVYSWTPGSSLSDSTAGSVFAFPMTTTTYQLDVTNACGVFSDTVTLTSKSAPTADAGLPAAFCFGGSVQLTGTGGVSYNWSPNLFLSCTACDKTNANPPSDMTYYVTVTDSFGCTDMDSVLVEVNGVPVSASAVPSTLCSPTDSVQLEVSGSIDIEDDFDPGIDGSVWSGVIGGSASTACLSVTGNALYFDGATTRTAETIDLNVSGGGTVDFWLHIADITLGTCEDADPTEEVYLEYSINGGFTWVNMSTYLTTAFPAFAPVSEPIPAGAQTGSTRFRWNQPAHSGSCCDHWAIDDMVINTVGDSLDTNAIVFWSPGTSLNDSTILTPLAAPGGQMTYVVTVDDQGCLTTDTITIYMDSTVLSMSTDTAFCQGNTAGLGVISNTPVAGYLWSPAAGLSSTTVQFPTASPSVTTNYEVEVTNTAGCVFTDSVMITIDTVPLAAFSETSSDLMATFINTSVNATSYLWDFGDGFMATVTNPVHTYNNNGTYNVCLIATNSCGSDTTCSGVSVTLGGCNNTVAAFDTITVGLTGVFTDLSTDATGWSWDFGDGVTSLAQNPVHTYALGGTYNVCLVTSNPCSSDTLCIAVTVASSGPPCTPTTASFTSNSVGLDAVFSDGSPNATSWSWDFGDGNNSASQNPVHTYGADGTYTVCLIASNACSSDTVCQSVVVSASSCTPATAGFSSSASGLAVSFTDTSTDPTAWSWDFGDGNVSTLQNPGNTYSAPGTYTVCLIVTNPCSADTSCTSITVTACSVPVASFSSSASDLTVSFTDASTNATSWSWDFGDGNTSNSQSPTYSFSTAGTYTVCLTVSSGCATNTYCDSVTVTSCPAVISAFTYTDSALAVSFSDLSVNAGSWFWDFGDGFNSSTQNATHVYALPGNYTVCLAASSACKSDTSCMVVSVVLTGLDGEPTEPFMEVYPNPTDGALNLSVPSGLSGRLSVAVYNMIGEVVFHAGAAELHATGSSADRVIYRLNLDDLANGAYLLKAESDDLYFMEQVIFSK